GATLVGRRIQNLIREAIGESLFPTHPGVLREPPEAKGHPPLRPHLDRHLICGAADAPSLYLQDRRDIPESLFERFDRRLLAALPDGFHRLIKDRLGETSLAVFHNLVDHHRRQATVVHGIGQYLPFCHIAPAWHV